jgi:hypothetical protein
MRYGYGSLRIFPREVVGCMELMYELDLQKYNTGMLVLSLVHLVGLSVEAYLVFLGTWLRVLVVKWLCVKLLV